LYLRYLKAGATVFLDGDPAGVKAGAIVFLDGDPAPSYEAGAIVFLDGDPASNSVTDAAATSPA
jgi:hypothetical protein